MSIDIRLDRVTKRFGEVVAVNGISLEIEHGSFFALLGPSGCGKTTTLRMIAGFEPVSEGVIYLGEQDVTGLPAYRRDVNTVFQSYALFPHLTVAENVAFGLRRRRLPEAEIRTRVGAMLDLVQLNGYDRRRPSELSGGQQQRVALARALVNHPRVLLLDEPLGALDLKLRKQMQIELKRIQTEVGITFVHVTHDQDEAMTMSDRIAVMRAGRIEQIGSAVELYDHPSTEFVAGFLGASNLLDGVVAESGRGLLEIALAAGGTVWAAAEPMARGAAVQVGVRPEKIRISPSTATEPTPGQPNRIDGTVTDKSYVGVSTYYLVRTDAGRELMVYAQNDGTDGAARPDVGARVQLRWRPEATFVLPVSSQAADQPVNSAAKSPKTDK